MGGHGRDLYLPLRTVSYRHLPWQWVGMDSIARLPVSYQHIFFYPLMAFGRINLYAQVCRQLWRVLPPPRRKV